MLKNRHPYPPNYGMDDVRKQAEWELRIEVFEAAVAEEKARLLKKKPWFPWRITIAKL